MIPAGTSAEARSGNRAPQDQLPPAQAHTPPPQINLAEHQIRRKQVLDGLISQYQIAVSPEFGHFLSA
jgi:hypothetical protein